VPVDSAGDGSLTTNFSATGSHVITAAYNGDSDCAASNRFTQQIKRYQIGQQFDRPLAMLGR
jgi:hypothetical protein